MNKPGDLTTKQPLPLIFSDDEQDTLLNGQTSLLGKPILEFNPKLPSLTDNEQEVLKILVEAARLIAPIYTAQENIRYPGANFYAHNLTKEEIQQAAEDDPRILSPYTVVEEKNGKIIAIPYFEKYAELLNPVAQKLLEAARLTDNEQFSKRLIRQAEALIEGTYEEAQIYWMSMEPYILDINIGPVERYDDKLFFIKTSYQAWVGVMDRKRTKQLERYKEIILSARREVLMPSEKIDYYDKIHLRVDDLLVIAGLTARTKFVGVNLPNDPNLMEKYGSEITIFKQTNEIRFQAIKKTFKRIFSPLFVKQFSDQDLKEGSLASTALHELSHTYLRYRHSEQRLEDLFPVIDELAATVMGIRVCGSLLVKDLASQQGLESIMLAYTCRSFHNCLYEAANKSKLHYTVDGAIFLNYLFKHQALQLTDGVSWPNFTKMFFTISDLASILERILSLGTRADAEHFIAQYGSLENIQQFK